MIKGQDMARFDELEKAIFAELSLEEQKSLLVALKRNIEQFAVVEAEKECARRLHWMLPAVSYIFGVPEANILTRDRRRNVVECRNALMLRLYREGHSIRSISKAMGLSRSTVVYSIDEVSGAVSSRNPSWFDFIEKWKTFNQVIDDADY